MIARAAASGRMAALLRFKLAGPMGADVGVAPRGDEQSHGTSLQAYAPRDLSIQPLTQEPFNTDALWNASTYDKLAPGRADGTFGQEVIG